MQRLAGCLAFAIAAFGPGTALAQEDEEADGEQAETEAAPDTPEAAPDPEDQPIEDEEPQAAPRREPTPIIVAVHDDDEEEEPEPSPVDPHEREGDNLYHFGVFARGIFAPQFIQNLFVEGGSNALNAGVGAFFNYRRDGFNVIAEVWWAGFYQTGPYHGLGETELETEWVEAELSVGMVSFAFMWSVPIASWLAFEIGFGLGFGGVFGDMWRTEAYPDATASAGWTPCVDENDGPSGAAPDYCDDPPPAGEGSYDRRNGTSQPYNFAGGVPPIWFWADLPRIALRIKPIRQIQIRIEAGFALYAFHFGGSLAFGF
jgi:hypothetical protein